MLKPLSPRQRKILEKLAEAVVPPGGPFALGAGDVGLADLVVDFVQNMGKQPWDALGGILWVVEFAPFLFNLRFSRFSKLPLEERVRFVEGLNNSRFLFKQGIALALRGFIAPPFYGLAQVAQAAGWTKGCYVKPPREIHAAR